MQAQRSPQAAQPQTIGSLVGAPAHIKVSGLGIRYSAEKGLVSFAEEVARATPTEAMQIERAGVPARYVEDLGKQLGLAATGVFTIINVPRATAENKASKNAFVTDHSGQAASVQVGSAWFTGLSSPILLLPSVIVPEEQAALINPRHALAARITAKTVRKF